MLFYDDLIIMLWNHKLSHHCLLHEHMQSYLMFFEKWLNHGLWLDSSGNVEPQLLNRKSLNFIHINCCCFVGCEATMLFYWKLGRRIGRKTYIQQTIYRSWIISWPERSCHIALASTMSRSLTCARTHTAAQPANTNTPKASHSLAHAHTWRDLILLTARFVMRSPYNFRLKDANSTLVHAHLLFVGMRIL